MYALLPPSLPFPRAMALRASLVLFTIMHSVLSIPVGIAPHVDDPSSVHSLSVLPQSVTSASTAYPLPSMVPVLAATDTDKDEDPGPAAERDGSSGAVISAASIGSVALVVVACGGCFFLGSRRKRPGFHMPTVLVDIETAREQPETPSSSPTSVRHEWRDFRRKSIPESESEGDSTQENYPPDGASNSRPPSYQSGKEPLYPPGPSSKAYHSDR